MAEEVWIQLYVGKEMSGGVFRIEIASLSKNKINYLAKAVAEERKDDLGHIHYSKLLVYKAGTEYPSEKEGPLRFGAPAPTDATGPKPLRVVAPSREQQQQAPIETQKSSLMLMAERTISILDAWSVAPPQVPTDIISLANFVKSELPSPLPWLQINSITSEAPVRDVMDASKKKVEDTSLLPALTILQCRILWYQRYGTSENTLHGIVDDLILAPIKLLSRHVGLSFWIDRNSASTFKNLRPDVMVWLPSGVLAFKGEDKADASDLRAATSELSTKMPGFTNTFLGNLQYQLCYAMGGLQLQFCAHEQKGNGRYQLHSLTYPVDLATIQGRSLCVRYAVNIARLLIAMHRQDPHCSVIRLGDSIRSRSSEVYILDDYIIKRPKKCTDPSVLVGLYELLKRSGGVDGLIRVREANLKGSHITLHLEPVGKCGQEPESINEAKVAAKRVLTALHYLHDNGWVHRDIRPANVMFADQNWYLVDLEWASVAGSATGKYMPQEQWTPPEIVGEDSEWTIASDMWQFHKLLSGWNLLDEEGRHLLRLLQSEDPQARISAEVALGHAYFS